MSSSAGTAPVAVLTLQFPGAPGMILPNMGAEPLRGGSPQGKRLLIDTHGLMVTDTTLKGRCERSIDHPPQCHQTLLPGRRPCRGVARRVCGH